MTKNKSFLFSCILTVGLLNFTYSQNSIKSVRDSISINLFNNPKKAKQFSHKLLTLSKEKKLIKDESNAYYFLADLCGTLSQKDSAFYYYDKAIQKATEINNEKLILFHKMNKSNYLFSEFDFDSALTLYNECLGLAKKTNNDYIYNYILLKRGNINYEIGKYKEALEIFKKGLKNKEFEKITVLGIKLSLSKTYLKLNEPDSAFVLIKKGIAESHTNNLREFEIHFLNQEGLTHIYKESYSKAKKSFEKAMLLSHKDENIEMTRLLLINMSKLYTLQNDNLKAISLLKEIKENKGNIAISSENLAEIHYLLAENYKTVDSLTLSNFYFQKFIDESKKLGQKKIETLDHLHKMDVSEINDQKLAQVKQKWTLIIILIVVLVVILIFYYKKRKNDLENQIKFDSLMLKINTYDDELLKNQLMSATLPDVNLTNNIVSEIKSDTEYIADHNTETADVFIDFQEDEKTVASEILNNSFIIKDETITEILEKLIKMEEKKYFLKQECTLHNVAKKLKTNTAYLSKIVNNELGKNFSTYINELRINYVIIELKNNPRLRSYSINAIAEEVGYKSPESFTKYFKAAAGISPSIYIKKINKFQEN